MENNLKNGANSSPARQAQEILDIRKSFFDDLLKEWSRPPEKIDEVMGQQSAFLVPDFAASPEDKKLLAAQPLEPIMIRDEARGLLAVSVTPRLRDGSPSSLRWVYSILHAGDWLRYGVLIQGHPREVLYFERQHDYASSIEQIWDRRYDHQFRDAAGLLLEWRFNEPNFYDQYMIQERFTIMARHLHFRLGLIMNSIIDAGFQGEEDEGQS